MLELSPSQQQAVDEFKRFMSSDNQVFMLKGAAGTGKTTLIIEFLKIIEADKRPVVLMAPTGRAAHILGKKTNRSAYTIHKSIYSLTKVKPIKIEKEEEDDGGLHSKFDIRKNKSLPNEVYIVDEASMVSDAFSESEAFTFGSGYLLTDLFDYARGRKIVFVGDYAQLPPVGMNFSPALSKGYLEHKFSCKITEIMLREVLRQQEGSAMLANSTRIRDNIENGIFIEFRVDDGKDTFAENNNLLWPYYKLSQDKPSVKSAVIAYTNAQALQYNLAIRRHYFGENAPRLQPGDLLMIARNNYAYDEELFNGNIVLVEACVSDGEVETRHVGVKTSKDNVVSVDLRFRKATIKFAARGKAVSMTVMLLDNFLDDPDGSVGGTLARALIVDFEKRLPSEIKSRLPEIKRLMRSQKELTTEQQELLDAYTNKLHYDPYYNAVVCKYGYAMTCHKAQGGEWDNVFVDMSRIGGTANENYFRWAYTALTRASEQLWHYRAPEFSYISNLVIEEIKPAGNLKTSVYSEEGDFCGARFARIQKICEEMGMTASEDRSRAYQHRITITDDGSNSAAFNLWYKNKGYSDRESKPEATSESFLATCKEIINKSLAPADVPFKAPERPFAEKLAEFIKNQIHELDIQLLDIAQEQYQDVYHLKTDGIATVALFYTDRGNYTYMRLLSTLGKDDAKLEALRQRFL